MPLPIMTSARRCTAKAKSTQTQCQNPAAHGCNTCRMHGARDRESIKAGKAHPNYIHGNRTKQAGLEASQTAGRLRHLEDMAHAAGILTGPKTRGRKPKTN